MTTTTLDPVQQLAHLRAQQAQQQHDPLAAQIADLEAQVKRAEIDRAIVELDRAAAAYYGAAAELKPVLSELRQAEADYQADFKLKNRPREGKAELIRQLTRQAAPLRQTLAEASRAKQAAEARLFNLAGLDVTRREQLRCDEKYAPVSEPSREYAEYDQVTGWTTIHTYSK